MSVICFVVLCVEFNCYKNGPRYETNTRNALRPSFWGIVMVMVVLVRGAVYQRLTAQPAPPSLSSWVLSCLSCSAVFLELYFMFSVFFSVRVSKCVSAWVYKQALTLFKTYGGGYYYCYACVFYMCTVCTLRCVVCMYECMCVANVGDLMLISQVAFLVVLVRYLSSIINLWYAWHVVVAVCVIQQLTRSDVEFLFHLII